MKEHIKSNQNVIQMLLGKTRKAGAGEGVGQGGNYKTSASLFILHRHAAHD